MSKKLPGGDVLHGLATHTTAPAANTATQGDEDFPDLSFPDEHRISNIARSHGDGEHYGEIRLRKSTP